MLHWFTDSEAGHEPQAGQPACSKRFWLGLRKRYADLDPRWPPNTWRKRFSGEPGDAEEVDEKGGFVASELPARRRPACVGSEEAV